MNDQPKGTLRKVASIVIILITLALAFTSSGLLTNKSLNDGNLSTPSTEPNYVFSPYIPGVDEKIVCIVFDDGWKSQLSAIPVLDSYGFKATFGIITSVTSSTSYLNWSQIQSLANDGMDIESHSYSHANLSASTSGGLYREVKMSKYELKAHGYYSEIFIYPYGEGFNNNTVKSYISNYYLCARSVDSGVNNLSNLDRYNIKTFIILDYLYLNRTNPIYRQIGKVIGNNIGVLCYHQIDDSVADEYSISLQQFKEQMKYLHDNNFTVITMKQLFLQQTN
ncbi:MAG: polysaccharide deacetylase family protein [Candidatus Bathyarchaeota archaeon]